MRRKSVFLLLAIAIIGVILSLIAILHSELRDPITKIDEELASLSDQEYFSSFTDHMLTLANTEGLDKMRARVVNALSNGQINMFHCHSLAHDIGHLWAVDEFYNTLASVINSEILDFCGSGFLHGIEGELATFPYPEYAIRMQEFCQLISKFEHYYSECFHGAGHTFLSLTGVNNIPEALAYCDSLKLNEDISVTGCYRGVFSESAEQLMRGEATPVDLLEICLQQETQLQEYCAYELNGFGARPGTPVTTLNEHFALCFSDSRATLKFSEACLASVTWVYTDIVIGDYGLIEIPPYVTSLSSYWKQLYIQHTFNAFKKQITTLPKSIWTDFCDKFESEDIEYCELQYKAEI